MDTHRRSGQLRELITLEAARLMYEEEVKQYFTAKRMAAKRVLGRSGGRRLRYRPRDLPSNGEIQAALLELARATEGELHQHRLFALRAVALEVMRLLEGFSPRLIGSVSTGHVRRGSDIDLHVFTDEHARLVRRADALGWDHELKVVTIRRGGGFEDYTHLYAEVMEFPVELSIYLPAELRVTRRSSTDGKPIRRVKPAALLELIRAEHPEQWERYRTLGTIPMLDEVLEDEQRGMMTRWV